MVSTGGVVGVWDPSTQSVNVQWMGDYMNLSLLFVSHPFPHSLVRKFLFIQWTPYSIAASQEGLSYACFLS